MAQPLLITLAVAGPLHAVRPADVDGDGVSELVFASGRQLDGPVVLEVVELGTTGEAGRRRFDLPARASWWDAGHGLWVVDDRGLVEQVSGKRVLTEATGLPGGGSARPSQAGMITDVDDNDQVEVLVSTASELLVVGEGGQVWGRLPAAPQAELVLSQRAGGQVRSTSLVAPAVVVADMDGNGYDDIVLIGQSEARVHRSASGGVAPSPTRIRLPDVLQPARPGAPTDLSEVTHVHWADMSGDDKADLVVHRLRSDGRLTGTEAEAHLFLGTGSGLGPAQVVSTGAGSTEAYLVDFDGDGLDDVLLPQLSLDAGNLAQAVLSRTVDVQLTLLRNQGGRLGQPETVGRLTLPVEDSQVAWSLFDDLDGDGLPDLALAVDGRLRLYRNEGARLASRPWAELELGMGVTNLWAVDLTGDGRAELVGWTPEARRMAVVVVR